MGPQIIAAGTTDPANTTPATVSAGPEWKSRYKWGVRDRSTLFTLPVSSYITIMEKTGIHEGVLGPCRQVAKTMALILMFRHIKPAAMEYVGQVNMLPKPSSIKRKTFGQYGVIAYESSAENAAEIKEKEFADDIARGAAGFGIDRHYAEAHGLRIDHDGSAAGKAGIRLTDGASLLVDKQGRGFFSDMDLFQVLDAVAGNPVEFGDGVNDTSTQTERRTKLDRSINVMINVGVNLVRPDEVDRYGLVQHGAERQYADHKARDETVAAITPDGAVWTLPNYATSVAFENHIKQHGGYNPESLAQLYPGNYIAG